MSPKNTSNAYRGIEENGEDSSVGLVPDGRIPLSLGGALLAALSDGKSLTITQLKQSPVVVGLLSRKKENSFYTALSRLMRRGVICKIKNTYELGVKGQYQVLRSYVLANQRNNRNTEHKILQKPWDGKWRVVVFDVPERQRPLRDFLRNTMKRLGAHELLRSIWIYPYRLPHYLQKVMASEFYRGKAYSFTTADIEYDSHLRKAFKLN
jgi:DNA-binding transcriptional regulator PaaX